MKPEIAQDELEPPPPYRWRPATMADVEAATAFFNICEIDESGEPDFELAEVRADWEQTDLARNVRLVTTPDGEIVASMHVTPRSEGLFETSGYTHPEHRGRGLGSFVVDWSERRALADDVSETLPAGRRVRSWVSTFNPHSSALFSGREYHEVRRFMRMEIKLSAAPAAPELPDGYEFRDPDFSTDLPTIYGVLDDAFSEHWAGHARSYDEWKERAMGFGHDPSLWSLIWRGEDLVAEAIGQNLEGLGWIKSVGVLKPERGKGLGIALLQHQFGRFWEKGLTKVQLGVDSENTTGAVALYERVGMSMINSYQAYEKVLHAQAESPTSV